jgi:hypothetical protein
MIRETRTAARGTRSRAGSEGAGGVSGEEHEGVAAGGDRMGIVVARTTRERRDKQGRMRQGQSSRIAGQRHAYARA